MAPAQTDPSGLTLSEQITVLIFLLMIIGSLVAIIYNLAVSRIEKLTEKSEKQGEQLTKISSAVKQIAIRMKITLEDFNW